MIAPDRRLRRAMLAGVVLTLIGVVGMALTVTGGPGGGISPWWFAPFYLVGSLLLIWSGIRWLMAVMGR